MTRASPVTRTDMLAVIQRVEVAVASLLGLASCVSPLGLSESDALYYELMDTLLRADEAGIVFEDDLLVVRVHQLVETLSAQLRTNFA
jgi:hypothetical protein